MMFSKTNNHFLMLFRCPLKMYAIELLALRNMTNIEHRSLFQLLQNLRPRDAEGLGKRRPDASRLYAPSHLRSCENRVLSSNNSAREHGCIDCVTNCTLQHASKRYIVLIYVCLGRVFL